MTRHPWLALVDGLGLLLVLGFALQVLPARYLPFDLPLGLLALSFCVSALALLRGGLAGARVAGWAIALRMLLGLGFLGLLTLTAADISGRFGPIGPVGAGFMVFGLLLFFPYVIVFPALQLAHLTRVHGGDAARAARRLRGLLLGALTALGLALLGGRAYAMGHTADAPSEDVMRAAFAAMRGEGEAPAHVAAGPVVLELIRGGRSRAQYVGTESLHETVEGALARFGTPLPTDGHWVVSVPTRRSRPSPLPWLHLLQIAPLHDGVLLTRGDARAVETPTVLQLSGAHVAVPFAPMPVFQFGTDFGAIVARLGAQLEAGEPAGDPIVEVLRFATFTDPPFRDATHRRPLPEASEAAVRAAVVDSVEFIVRFQRADGLFGYQVDAARGIPNNAGYDFTRHAGVAYFLAQAARMLPSTRALLGAERGVRFLTQRVRPCGPHGARCVVTWNGPEFGSTALFAAALFDLRAVADTPELAQLQRDLLTFLHAQQRPDGEMRHGFDLERGEPIDVQLMYFSGEAALALVRGAASSEDPADRDAATRLLRYLAVTERDALGEPYLMGEEHWTCIAYGEYQTLLGAELPEVRDFCDRWAAFSRRVQYDEGETVWDVTGAYGLGPIIPPQMSGTATRTEAFAALASWHGDARDPDLERQVERGVQALLQHHFLPGPTHLMRRPEAMRGGTTGALGDLVVRNDFVQHAGSAYLRYLSARF
ncbi:MAG: hypothetical protein R3B40_23205 [Polyangiales bacterium]